MKCPRCTQELKEGAQFCTNCGLRIASQQPVQPQRLIQPQQTAQPQRPVQMQHPVAPQQQMQQPQRLMTPQLQMQQQRPMQPQQPKQKSKTGLIIVLLCVLAILIGVMVWLLLKGNDDSEEKKSASSSRTENEYESDEPGTPDKPDEPQEPSEPADVPATSAVDTHTVMVYIVGSDLESNGGNATLDIQEMLAADYEEDINVVIQTGGSYYWQREEMDDGKVQRFEVKDGKLVELEALGKMSMLTVDALADFITFAAKNYPADKYTLFMWDHGGGTPIYYGYDELFPYDQLYDVEIGYALEKAGVSFESIVFDACNMCTLEVAMAIKDYAKYMVAAESYTWDIGMSYDVWLNYLDDNRNASALESCELLVTEYMESIAKRDLIGSMSLINLSKIQNVYDAYEDYLVSVHNDLKNDGYAEYIKARSACGEYGGTETADLITLATAYHTDMSTELMNAVVNAVYYTDSDFLYGHGLAAYSPYAFVDKYDIARSNMEDLGYTSEVLECYDAFVSINMAYTGQEFVDANSGAWFDSDIAYSYVEVGTEAGEYYLETTEKDGYYAICLSENDWNVVSTVEAGVIVILDDENGLLLGQDYYYVYDEEGDIAIGLPEYWVRVNRTIASYICTDIYEDVNTGEWSQSGLIYARCNGQDVMLVVYYDEDYPQGTLVGYMPYDFVTEEYGQVQQLRDDDVIELISPIMNTNTGEITYENVTGESILASDIELTYESIEYEGYEVVAYYVVYDIYGNTYTTDDFYF